MTLASAQRIIASNWVTYFNQDLTSNPQPVEPQPPAPPVLPGPSDGGIVHPGAFCTPPGATGQTDRGTPMVCGPASDGTNRWHSA